MTIELATTPENDTEPPDSPWAIRAHILFVAVASFALVAGAAMAIRPSLTDEPNTVPVVANAQSTGKGNFPDQALDRAQTAEAFLQYAEACISNHGALMSNETGSIKCVLPPPKEGI